MGRRKRAAWQFRVVVDERAAEALGVLVTDGAGSSVAEVWFDGLGEPGAVTATVNFRCDDQAPTGVLDATTGWRWSARVYLHSAGHGVQVGGLEFYARHHVGGPPRVAPAVTSETVREFHFEWIFGALGAALRESTLTETSDGLSLVTSSASDLLVREIGVRDLSEASRRRGGRPRRSCEQTRELCELLLDPPPLSPGGRAGGFYDRVGKACTPRLQGETVRSYMRRAIDDKWLVEIARGSGHAPELGAGPMLIAARAEEGERGE